MTKGEHGTYIINNIIISRPLFHSIWGQHMFSSKSHHLIIKKNIIYNFRQTAVCTTSEVLRIASYTLWVYIETNAQISTSKVVKWMAIV